MIPTTNNPNSESRPAANNSQRSYLILLRLILILVLLFIIIRVSIFSAWLILKPQLPLVTLSNFSLSSDHNLLNIDQPIRFSIKNPNKKIKVYFDFYEVLLSCGRMILLRASSEKGCLSFEVGKKSQKNLTVKLKSFSTERGRCGLRNWDRRSKFGDNKKSYGHDRVMRFKVQMLIGMKYSALNDWLIRRKTILVFCKAEVYFFAADGKGKLENGDKKECLVHFSRDY